MTGGAGDSGGLSGDVTVTGLPAARFVPGAAGDGALAGASLDRAAAGLGAARLHVAAQRLRAAIAVFFSRHKDAPALLSAPPPPGAGRGSQPAREAPDAFAGAVLELAAL